MQGAVGSSGDCLLGCGCPEVNVFLIWQTVTCNVHERDVSSFTTQAKETVGKEVTFSPGTYPEFSGTAQARAQLLVRVRLRRLLAPRSAHVPLFLNSGFLKEAAGPCPLDMGETSKGGGPPGKLDYDRGTCSEPSSRLRTEQRGAKRRHSNPTMTIAMG